MVRTLPFRGKDTGSFPVEGILFMVDIYWKRSKLVNILIKKGNKFTSFKIVNDLFRILNEKILKLSNDELKLINKFYINDSNYLAEEKFAELFFEEAIHQLNPLFKFSKYKSKRGRRTEMLPVVLSKKEQITSALKILISNALKRSKKNTIAYNLADEILDTCIISKNHVKSRNDLFKLAYINRRRVII